MNPASKTKAGWCWSMAAIKAASNAARGSAGMAKRFVAQPRWVASPKSWASCKPLASALAADHGGDAGLVTTRPIVTLGRPCDGQPCWSRCQKSKSPSLHAWLIIYESATAVKLALRQNRTVVLKNRFCKPAPNSAHGEMTMDLKFTPEEQAFREEVRDLGACPFAFPHFAQSTQRLALDP